MGKIHISDGLTIDESELEESFVQSGGPGGQNVNKVATTVQLRFDAAHSPSLPDSVRERLLRTAGRRLTKDGVLVVFARRFRTQERNREDARARLVELIQEAAVIPATRHKTKVPKAAKRRRGEAKQKHSKLKRLRARPAAD
jgi:ribosome-associated protein